MANRRHPLFDRILGLGIEAIGIDVLHTVHQGVLQDFLATCIWYMVMIDAFNCGATTKEDKLRHTVLHLMAGVRRWYPEYERTGQQ